MSEKPNFTSAPSTSTSATSIDPEVAALIYGEAKEILRVISMHRSHVLPDAQLLQRLAEHAELLSFFVEELGAPTVIGRDGKGELVHYLLESPRARRIVGEAIRQAIQAHGPIDSNWVGSTSKRVRGALRRHANMWRKQLRRTEKEVG